MEFVKSRLEGVYEIFPRVFEDERGYFFESYNQQVFEQNGIKTKFIQDNESKSSKGVLRGLHFQKPPYSQSKLVRVIQGSVLDVVVDIRASSPTYGQYEKFILEASKHNMVLVPTGFAHGFLSLEDDTIFHYKCSALYNKSSEEGLMWDDATLNIDWGKGDFIISDKDKDLQKFEGWKSPFI